MVWHKPAWYLCFCFPPLFLRGETGIGAAFLLLLLIILWVVIWSNANACWWGRAASFTKTRTVICILYQWCGDAGWRLIWWRHHSRKVYVNFVDVKICEVDIDGRKNFNNFYVNKSHVGISGTPTITPSWRYRSWCMMVKSLQHWLSLADGSSKTLCEARRPIRYCKQEKMSLLRVDRCGFASGSLNLMLVSKLSDSSDDLWRFRNSLLIACLLSAKNCWRNWVVIAGLT